MRENMGTKRNSAKTKKHLVKLNSVIHDPTLLDSMDWVAGDWGCDPDGELSSDQTCKLWERVRGTLSDAMLDKDNALRISQNTGFSLIDLYSMVYRVRVPNEKELIHLCNELMME